MLHIVLVAALAAANANIQIGHTYQLSAENFGSPVCARPELLGQQGAECPLVPGGPSVTVLAKGLPHVVWGMDLTPVEIAVPVRGQAPVMGWTSEMFLKN